MSIVNFKNLNYDEIKLVSQINFNDKDRPEVSNKFRKILFFILKEGVFKTYRKIKSKKTNRFTDNKFYTLVVISLQNKIYGNLSIQYTENSDDFIISNRFFEVRSDVQINDFLIHKERFNQFVSHSNHSAIPIPEIPEGPENDKEYTDGVFLFGLGDYSRVFIAPQIRNLTKICCVDYNIHLSRHFQTTYKFNDSGLVPQDSYGLLNKTQNPLAIIATYHSDHARLAKEITDINPNSYVFIEKPPCVTLEDLDILLELYSKGLKIEIGYNRRYIPINQKTREWFRNKTKVINISVKEIKINDNHWYFWQNQGTRITGNLTHWIDLATYWIDEKPIEMTMLPSIAGDETIGLSILYDKGSLVNISVSDKGNSLKGVQEIIEIRTGEETVLINDYMSMRKTNAKGKLVKTNFKKRDKGHERMYKELIKSYNDNNPTKYPEKDLIYTTIITFFAAKMFRENIRHMELSEKLDHYLKD